VSKLSLNLSSLIFFRRFSLSYSILSILTGGLFLAWSKLQGGKIKLRNSNKTLIIYSILTTNSEKFFSHFCVFLDSKANHLSVFLKKYRFDIFPGPLHFSSRLNLKIYKLFCPSIKAFQLQTYYCWQITTFS